MAVLGTARAGLAPAELSAQLQVAQESFLFETGRTSYRTPEAWKAWWADILRYCRALAGLIGSTASMLAFVFAAWSITADLSWTSGFPWSRGPLSHWLTWCAVGAPLRIAARWLAHSSTRHS
jgi:hypothetical protein